MDRSIKVRATTPTSAVTWTLHGVGEAAAPRIGSTIRVVHPTMGTVDAVVDLVELTKAAAPAAAPVSGAALSDAAAAPGYSPPRADGVGHVEVKVGSPAWGSGGSPLTERAARDKVARALGSLLGGRLNLRPLAPGLRQAAHALEDALATTEPLPDQAAAPAPAAPAEPPAPAAEPWRKPAAWHGQAMLARTEIERALQRLRDLEQELDAAWQEAAKQAAPAATAPAHSAAPAAPDGVVRIPAGSLRAGDTIRIRGTVSPPGCTCNLRGLAANPHVRSCPARRPLPPDLAALVDELGAIAANKGGRFARARDIAYQLIRRAALQADQPAPERTP